MAQMVKHLPTMRETWVWSLGQEDPLERAMAARSSILDWEILRPEEPVRRQSRGSRRVRHDWASNTYTSKEAAWTSNPDLYITPYTCTSTPPPIHQLLPMAMWEGSHITNKERRKIPSWECAWVTSACGYKLNMEGSCVTVTLGGPLKDGGDRKSLQQEEPWDVHLVIWVVCKDNGLRFEHVWTHGQ